MDGAAALTMTQAGRALRERRLSCVELLDAVLEQARRTEPEVHAYVELDGRARAQAERLDAELRTGTDRGPLHGIPFAVKDLADVAGLPTRGGSRVTDEDPAARDSAIVARAREAGAVITGKTTTHELAFGVTTRGTANPYDRSRMVGGSSGGSAAAVAAGSALAALGSDTAGSIRIPSAFCGVTGLKPRHGTLPMEGMIALAPRMDVAGPIARTAEDVAGAWTALSGALPTEPLRAPVIGLPGDWDDDLDDDVAAAIRAAVETLREAGASIVDADLPAAGAWEPMVGLSLTAEALEVHRSRGWYPQRRARYGEHVRTNLDRMSDVAQEPVAQAREQLAALTAAFARALEPVDAVLLPVTPSAAPPRAAEGDVARSDARHARAFTRRCSPVNITGCAAVALPCGATAGGLPIGMQLVARDEAHALGAALAFQRETDFHHRRP